MLGLPFKTVKRHEARGGIVTYKTWLGGVSFEIWPYTNSFTHIRTFLFLLKWKRKGALDAIKALTYDWVETSTDEDGYETTSGYYLVGYRLKDDAEPTLFRMSNQEESYEVVSAMQRDLGVSIDRKKYL